MKRNKGFTLAELLVVVAIIAVLVAISIPIFTSQLEKSRESVDIANMRNAYSLMSLAVIDDEVVDNKKASLYSSSNPLYYDGSKLTSNKTSALGHGTSINGNVHYSACDDYQYEPSIDYSDKAIVCYYDSSTNKVHVHWTSTNSNDNNNSNNNNNSNTITIDNKTINVNTLPSSIEGNSTYTIKTGYVYSYKGVNYVALSEKGANQYYYPTPDDASWLYLSLTSKVIKSDSVDSSGRITVDLKAGDVYSDGTNLYIRKTDAYANQSVIPSQDTSNWQLINS